MKPNNHKLVETSCSSCGEVKLRRKDFLVRWNGRCRSCAQKVAVNVPGRLEKVSELAREQIKRQGGIPNAKKFTSERVRGDANHRWKGGITPENNKERTSKKYVEWRNSVMRRDKFTCQLCGQVGRDLQAHHKKEWSLHIELRYDLNNGVTLCQTCHKEKAHSGAFRNPAVPWETLTNA